MDDFRIIELVFLFLTYVLVSNQMVPNDVTTMTTSVDVTTTSQTDDNNSFQCPLINAGQTNTVHNITRSVPCKNGKNMDGCCVERFYCDYNTSHIDLTLYGPSGYRMPCQLKEMCCPQKYILPIPLPNATKDDNDSDISDSSLHVDSDD